MPGKDGWSTAANFEPFPGRKRGGQPVMRAKLAEVKWLAARHGHGFAVVFKMPSEIMNHFGRKGGPQGVEHGQNVNDFLGDGADYRT